MLGGGLAVEEAQARLGVIPAVLAEEEERAERACDESCDEGPDGDARYAALGEPAVAPTGSVRVRVSVKASGGTWDECSR